MLSAITMLNRFQALKKAVDAKFDLPDTVLSSMARACLDGEGIIREPYRSRLREKAPDEALALMESAYRANYGGCGPQSR